jgi:hypothetical protein
MPATIATILHITRVIMAMDIIIIKGPVREMVIGVAEAGMAIIIVVVTMVAIIIIVEARVGAKERGWR